MKTFYAILFASSMMFFGCNGGANKADDKTGTDSTATISSESQNEEINIEGTYNFKSETNSKTLSFTISRTDKGYVYDFTLSDGSKCSGNIIVDKSQNEEGIFAIFDGQILTNKPKDITASITKEGAIIQNYGNSMNQYCWFSDIDEKFLEFSKTE